MKPSKERSPFFYLPMNDGESPPVNTYLPVRDRTPTAALLRRMGHRGGRPPGQ